MREGSTNIFVFLVILSATSLFSCAFREPEPTPPPDLTTRYSFSADDYKYIKFRHDQLKEIFLKRLRVTSDYDTPRFESEKLKYSAKYRDLAKEYLAWRQQNGTYYEDYDYYRFIFQKIEEGFSFPSYEYEHILKIAEVIMEENEDVILFAPAYAKEDFLERVRYTRNGESALVLTEFTAGFLRKSIIDSREEKKRWCIINEIPSRIEIDNDGNAIIAESDSTHSIDFIQRIYGFEYEKETVFELIAATKTGREFLPDFLREVNENNIKIAFEEFPGNPNKITLTAGKWDPENKKLSLNSKYFWTYGSMAAILFHEIIHTFEREKTAGILPREAATIKELEGDIILLNELLTPSTQTSDEHQRSQKELNDRIKKLKFYDELIAYSYQYDFAQEMYKLFPCTLLHLRTKDVQGLKDEMEIKVRTES